MATLATAKDFSRTMPGGASTPAGSSVPPLDDRLTKLETFATDVQAVIGTDDVTDASSLQSRSVSVLEQGIPVSRFNVGASNSAAVNGAALNTMIANYGAFGGATLLFPPGVFNLPNHMHGHVGGVRLKGVSNTSTILRNTGTGAGNAFFETGGVDSYGSGRTYNWDLEDIGITNAATTGADSQQVAFANISASDHHMRRVRIQYFRGGVLTGFNNADSFFDQCEFEWCGSINNTDTPVFFYSGAFSAYWAADEIRFTDCRWEHCGERIMDLRFQGGFYVSKFRFDRCKFENVKSDGDGIGGDPTTGAQFYLENTNGVQFNNCDFTYANLRSGYTGPAPRMFWLHQTNATQFNNCFIPVADAGATARTFTTTFDCDGDTGTVLNNVQWTAGNGNAYPVHEFTFRNGGGAKFGRHNTGWAYTPGGSPPPVSDSGSPASTCDWA